VHRGDPYWLDPEIGCGVDSKGFRVASVLAAGVVAVLALFVPPTSAVSATTPYSDGPAARVASGSAVGGSAARSPARRPHGRISAEIGHIGVPPALPALLCLAFAALGVVGGLRSVVRRTHGDDARRLPAVRAPPLTA
jgi:hypothetical protein